MKKFYASFVLCLLIATYVQATTYYWVTSGGGNWNSASNWSTTGGAGSGGAGVPGLADSVVFTNLFGQYAVNLDVSPAITSLTINAGADVRLYTSVNTTFTLTGGVLDLRGSLLDSTSEDVNFNFLLDHASANLLGSANWIFAGRVPLSSGRGAMFTAGTGAAVVVENGTTVYLRNNAGDIAVLNDPSQLRFRPGSHFVADNNLNFLLPTALWSGPYIDQRNIAIRASEILIRGNAQRIRYGNSPNYTAIALDLFDLSTDFDLSLPNGVYLTSAINVVNTNGHTLTLLSQSAPNDTVSVRLGSPGDVLTNSGNLFISGANTKVALARASATTPGTTYRLQIVNLLQSGGSFSLQDGNNATGSTTLAVYNQMTQNGGTFAINSTSTSARYAVQFIGPYYSTNSPVFSVSEQGIDMQQGTLDANGHPVALQMADVPFTYVSGGGFYQYTPVGLHLRNPLQVTNLGLYGGPVFTSSTATLTVTDPSPTAVIWTNPNSYVVGPLIRATNAAVPYTMHLGKTPVYTSVFPSPPPSPFSLDTCVIIPASATPSQYSAQYFGTRYPDTTVTAPFRGIDTSQYWDITKISGADAQVQLIVNKAVPRAAATDNLVVAHYVNGQWISEQGTVLTPGNATTGSVTSKVLSTFSPFTFGYGMFAAALPIHLLSFDGHAENGGARLNWKVAETASRFEVQRSGDGVNFKQVGTVQAQAVQQQYAFLDPQLPAGNSFYRLRMVEKDGSFTLSDVIMITSTGQLTELLTLAPNMVRSTANLRINALKDGQLQLVVTDMSGRSWKKWVVTVKAGSASNLLNLADLPAGTYQLTGYLDGRQTPVIRFIKQ